MIEAWINVYQDHAKLCDDKDFADLWTNNRLDCLYIRIDISKPVGQRIFEITEE